MKPIKTATVKPEEVVAAPVEETLIEDVTSPEVDWSDLSRVEASAAKDGEPIDEELPLGETQDVQSAAALPTGETSEVGSPETTIPAVGEAPKIAGTVEKATVVAEPEAPAAPAPTQAELQGKIDEYLTAQRTMLQKRYQISEEQTEQLQLNPQEVLPGMLADAHINAVHHAMQIVKQFMPEYMKQAMTAQNEAGDGEKYFFEQWPELQTALAEDPSREEIVNRQATLYRQLNPEATKEEFTLDVGSALMTAFKIPLKAAPSAGPSPKPQKRKGAYKPPAGGAAPAAASADELTGFAKFIQGEMAARI